MSLMIQLYVKALHWLHLEIVEYGHSIILLYIVKQKCYQYINTYIIITIPYKLYV